MEVRIRPAEAADAAGCLAIYAPFVRETAVSFETDVPSEDAFAERIRATLARMPWLVAEARGGPARIGGYAYAGRYRERAAYQWSVEVTLYVHPDFRGRGVGRALYERLLACLRQQGFCNAYAVITLPNPASVALHERLGFRPVGVFTGVGHKLGRWHDVGWWHLALRPLPERPEPPGPPAGALAGLDRGPLP